MIESHGDVHTKAGKPYRNSYCYVCKLANGQVRELTEYCDTQLLTVDGPGSTGAEARRMSGT